MSTRADSIPPFRPGYRASGVLLHVTSLPSPYGIGDLGPAAFAWVDRLHEAGQCWWQALPLGPTGYGDSPYQSLSSFAGNELLISPDGLFADELLRVADCVIRHRTAGLGIWKWASNDRGAEPDVVMACCGDVPTLETLAAVDLLRRHAPDLKVRVVNVVNLMKLRPPSEHPHGLSGHDFDALFTSDKPIVFAFHGYPWLVHRPTYRRNGHKNPHVRGYKEEGTTTTPFDMCVLNDLDRFHLASDVIDRVPKLGTRAAYAKQAIRDKLMEHKAYIARHGDDMPEITGWKWGQQAEASTSGRSTEADNV